MSCYYCIKLNNTVQTQEDKEMKNEYKTYILAQIEKANAEWKKAMAEGRYDDAFVYGNTMSLGKNGHIFDIEGTPKANSEMTADALFTIYFEFLNVAEYSSVVLTGSFNSKDNGTSTTLIYHSGDFVDDKITIDEYGLYSATLDTITISYKCVA